MSVMPDMVFEKFDESLMANQMIYATQSYDVEALIPPYCHNQAIELGWSWSCPKRSAKQVGLAYHDKYLTKSEAIKTLRKVHGELGEVNDPLIIQSGSLNTHWTKNCLAIGRSAAFIEPIVPVNIALIQFALNTLIHHFPDQSFYAPHIKGFNDLMTNHCCLLYTSPSPRDRTRSRMPSSA